MSLTNFRTLGRSGLVVSSLALGTMTFGLGEWGADERTSRAIFDSYRGDGGNFIDTADIYAGGESERLVGRFIADRGARDEVVLATKFAFNGSATQWPPHRRAAATLMRAGPGQDHPSSARCPPSNDRALTTSISTGCTSRTASRRSRRSSKRWATWSAPAKSATTACRTRRPDWR